MHLFVSSGTFRPTQILCHETKHLCCWIWYLLWDSTCERRSLFESSGISKSTSWCVLSGFYDWALEVFKSRHHALGTSLNTVWCNKWLPEAKAISPKFFTGSLGHSFRQILQLSVWGTMHNTHLLGKPGLETCKFTIIESFKPLKMHSDRRPRQGWKRLVEKNSLQLYNNCSRHIIGSEKKSVFLAPPTAEPPSWSCYWKNDIILTGH